MIKQTLGIYIRVSTPKQVKKGLSADDQQERGIQLANQLGWNYKLYDDRGLSGSKISFRDRELNELIKDCDNGLLTGIYCVEIDRWSRDKNYEEGQVIISLIKLSGVQVFTPTGEYKLDDPAVEFMVRLKSLFASFETINRTSSIKRNLERSAKMGRAKGGAFLPYGYVKGENKMLVIDKEEAKVVKEIYRMAMDTKNGTKVIAGYLNEKRYPTKVMKSGKGMMVRGVKKTVFQWRDKVVYDILTNSIYKGVRRHKDITVDAPIIIEPEIWDLVQIKIKQRNQFKDTNNIYQYLLKGLIVCPNCGSKIQGKKRANGKDNCYTCTSNRLGPNCGNRGINIEYLNDLVSNSILNMDTIIEEAFNNKVLLTKEQEYRKHIKSANEKIKELKSKQEKYLDAIVEGIVSREILRERLSNIEYQIEVFTNKKDIYEKQITIIDQKEALLQVARQGIEQFEKMRKFDQKVNFINEIISKITVWWESDFDAYAINIKFKLNHFENFLISKELMIDRNGRKDGKAVNKVLFQKVTLENLIQVDEENNILYQEPEVTYANGIETLRPVMVKSKRRKVRL